MMNFNLKRLALAGFFLIHTVLGPQALADAAQDRIVKSALEKMGPGSSIDQSEKVNNGVVTYTVNIYNCPADGSACRSSSYSTQYRTTRAEISVDGKRLLVETVDRKGGDYQTSPYERLSFKSSHVSDSADSMPLASSRDLDINPSNPVYGDVAAVLPMVVMGIADGIKNMQASANAARQLEAACNKVYESLGRANDHLVDEAQRSAQAEALASASFNILTAERAVQPVQSSNRSQEYQDYLKAARDPNSFREYEMTRETAKRILRQTFESAQKKQTLKTIQNAEMLLHQKDGLQRKAADQNLQPLFKDGVIRAQALGADEASPLDRARLQTAMHTPGGEVVRRLANKAQATWIDTQGLKIISSDKAASYIGGVAALKSADESFAQGREGEGLYYSQVANSLMDFSRGFVNGSLTGLTSAAQAVPAVALALGRFTKTLITDPAKGVKQLGEFVGSLPAVAVAVGKHYLQLGKQVSTGTASQRGDALGQITSDVVIALATDGVVSGLQKIPAGAFGAMGKLALQAREAMPVYLKYATQGTRAGMILTEAIQSGVIKSVEQIKTAERFLPALEKMPHQLDILRLGESNKVALIGRDMENNVLKIKELLRAQGIEAETFQLSTKALENWADLERKYGVGQVPVEEQRLSLGYAENKRWAENMVDQGYNILDAKNPGGKSPSIYYDELELSIFKGNR